MATTRTSFDLVRVRLRSRELRRVFTPSHPLSALVKRVGAVVPWVAGDLRSLPAADFRTHALARGYSLGCRWSMRYDDVMGSGSRRSSSALHDCLQVILRYALGIAMVTYGMAKIAHLQMLPPHLAKLVQPLGESSPTSLLWVFMGSSTAYSMFTGVIEAVGGALLFNRRTTTLGALVSLGSLSQVLALNLSYDVS